MNVRVRKVESVSEVGRGSEGVRVRRSVRQGGR